MKIAILSINIGRYINFWDKLYESVSQKFIVDAQKDFFVFTDAHSIRYEEQPNVHVIFQKDLGWPGNTLMRYHMFISQKEELKNYDYIFFFNANCVVVKNVGKEILPNKTEKLVFCRRHKNYLHPNKPLAYEKNPKSKAYVEDGNTKYVRGGLWGGEADAVLEMCELLSANIDEDEKNGIVAMWHDESHITRYAIDHPKAKVLSPSYLYPQEYVMPYHKIIMTRKKHNNSIRFGSRNVFSLIKYEVYLLFRNFIYAVLIAVRYIKWDD